MKHFSLILLVLALGCSRGNDSDQNQPENSDAAVQDNDSTGHGAPTDPAGQPSTGDDPTGEVSNKDDKPADATPANQFRVDASSTAAAAYFTLEKGALQATTADKAWLFNVKRTVFQTNSGTSGGGNIGVYETATTDYASVTTCAAGTLTFDEMLPASGAPGSQPYSGNAKLNAWYNYDVTTHVVSSKKLVYLVSDGTSCFKLQILSYESGIYQVLADVLEIPVVDPSQTIDASSSAAAAYVKTVDGKLAAGAADAAWEFNVKRTVWQTNSGTSGSGSFGVADTGATHYASVTSCSATTFTPDAMQPASGAPGSQPYSGSAILNAWYNYDMTTHEVSSKKLVYLISDGVTCYKLQILSYAAGVYKVLTDSVPIPPRAQPVTYEQTIDASSSTAPVYLKIADGKLAATTVDDGSWWLAVKRTQFQTNGGTSGTGTVGVYNSAQMDFAAVTSCTGLTFAADAMQPASGAPGSQPYSGSAILNAWYNYDMTTHVVSSKQEVYALSDGSQCLKVQLLIYASGVYTVKVSLL